MCVSPDGADPVGPLCPSPAVATAPGNTVRVRGGIIPRALAGIVVRPVVFFLGLCCENGEKIKEKGMYETEKKKESINKSMDQNKYRQQ